MKLVDVRLIVLSILCAGCVSSNEAVGVADFTVAPDAANPALNARIWYRSFGGVERRFGSSRIRPGYIAMSEATVALTKRAPLVVLLHGSGGSAESMAWIAMGLAQLGALVVAVDHPASSGGDPERASILEVWTQPDDVSRLLDSVMSSEWGTYVDSQRIAVVGFSLGGTSAMLLSGMRLQMERSVEFCDNHDDGACRAFSGLLAKLDSNYFQRANKNMVDSRFRAAVAIAPGFTESAVEGSLRNLGTPLLIIVGKLDQQLPPETRVYPIREYLTGPSRIVEIAEAQHFSFLPLCREDAATVLAETQEDFVCREFGGKTREEIHDSSLAVIVQFLLERNVLSDQ